MNTTSPHHKKTQAVNVQVPVELWSQAITESRRRRAAGEERWQLPCVVEDALKLLLAEESRRQ